MQRALAFLTPFGRSSTPDPSTLAWFPVVGALVGLAVGGVWWIAFQAWPPLVAAAIVVGSDLAFTGLLHVDGLADAGDGLLAPLSRDRRLAAMADPGVGAFGLVSVVVVVLLRYAAFASTRPAVVFVAGVWCASRSAIVVMMEVLPYARPGGLAETFLTSSEDTDHRRQAVRRGTLAVGMLAAFVMAVVGRGLHGLVAVGLELVAIAAVGALAQRRIGGFTGDVLGASCMVGETAALLVSVTR